MYPSNGAGHVWAVQGKDTLEMTNVDGEYILRSISPGSWQLFVEANTPYHNAHFDINDVKPGTDIDLGAIRLRK